MKGKGKLQIHAPHLAARAAERAAPVDAIAAFDAREWEVVTAEVRLSNCRFVNSAWTRVIDGRRWWVVIDLEETVMTVIETDKRGLGEAVVTGGELYDRVERVNRELMLAEADKATATPACRQSPPEGTDLGATL